MTRLFQGNIEGSQVGSPYRHTSTPSSLTPHRSRYGRDVGYDAQPETNGLTAIHTPKLPAFAVPSRTHFRRQARIVSLARSTPSLPPMLHRKLNSMHVHVSSSLPPELLKPCGHDLMTLTSGDGSLRRASLVSLESFITCSASTHLAI